MTALDVRFLLGADENGLGPRLGPMTTTAVLAASRARHEPVAAMDSLLGDSKALVRFGESALGEAWARVLAEREGAHPTSPLELVEHLSLDGRDALRAPCPRGHASMCWGSVARSFEAPEDLVDRCRARAGELAAAGLELRWARTAIVCTRRLNLAADEGRSRFAVDLEAMARLALEARAMTGPIEIDAVCGKVGGYERYQSLLAAHGLAGAVASVEGRARSQYRVEGFGTIAFERDADASHALVALASLVGKWVRDALMDAIGAHFRAGSPELPRASGYHDPVTARFVEATAAARRDASIEDDCFERRRAKPAMPLLRR